MGRHYSREEVAETIRRAADREHEGLSEEELVAVAEEVGLDADAVRRAAEEVAVERLGQHRRQAVVREQRRRLGRSIWSFMLVNATAVGINLMTGGELWFYWVTFGTGVMLANRLIRTFAPSDTELHRIERHLERRERRRSLRERERAEARERRQRSAERRQKLGRVIEHGVDALLDVAQDQLAKHREEQAAQPPTQGPRARVAEPGPQQGHETVSKGAKGRGRR